MIQPIELGRFRIFPLLEGYFKLDGGGMFGPVPKTLWSKLYPSDDQNRIRLAIRPLLVEAGSQWILIDTGDGDKWDAKWKRNYGIELLSTLDDQLAQVGLKRDDIRMVVNTHLHWDHAGGNTRKDVDGKWVTNFPNARFIIQRGEYEMATHTNERTRASYRPDDYVALERDGLIDFVDGDATLGPGVRVIRSGGHVPFHQCIYLESDKTRAFHLGDLVPTHAHLPPAYIPGFDLVPLETLDKKKEYLKRAAEEDWMLFFPHDPDLVCGKVQMEAGSYRLKR